MEKKIYQQPALMTEAISMADAIAQLPVVSSGEHDDQWSKERDDFDDFDPEAANEPEYGSLW